MKILDYLRQEGKITMQTPCGGRGTCGKCMVNVVRECESENGARSHSMERVLACQTEYEKDMLIVLPENNSLDEMRIVESYLLDVADGLHTRCNDDGEYNEGILAAVDIGTTTVVCHLIDGATGNIIYTVAYPNAQRVFGADVISRIKAAEHLQELRAVIVDQVRDMLDECLAQGNAGNRINYMTVVGNSVMCHLFTGISPEKIGRAPFVPDEYFGREYDGNSLGLSKVDTVYIAPSVSGFVGGDITSDLLVVDQINNTVGGIIKEAKEVLLLDIGTNGEMVLGNCDSYICCATAAGPAFEGAEIELGMSAVTGAISKVWLHNNEIRVAVIGESNIGQSKMSAKGICGTGLIDALLVFLETGLIDETGRIRTHREVNPKYARYLGEEDEDNDCIFLTEDVYITQDDIRKLQLAKAAIAAGVSILVKERGVRYEDIDSVIIAGGFGSYIDKISAARIGLIPVELLERTQAVGNAAACGAIIAATSKVARDKLGAISSKMKYIELSSFEGFEEEYIVHMNF